MHGVYSNSYRNISATAAEDNTAGLFRDRDVNAIRSLQIATPELERLGKEALVYAEDWGMVVERAPANKRAWVVQERFLAPRIVHFTTKQVYWECVTCRSLESLPGSFCPLDTLQDILL